MMRGGRLRAALSSNNRSANPASAEASSVRPEPVLLRTFFRPDEFSLESAVFPDGLSRAGASNRSILRKEHRISMTATMAKEQEMDLAADTFAALEQRVVRAIELLNREREQRIAAEKQLSETREQMEAHRVASEKLSREIDELHRERDTVRTRVERLMTTLESIEG
jgi:hypothetical protein